MGLPTSGWKQYLETIRAAGEKRRVTAASPEGFLSAIGLLDGGAELSDRGRNLYDALYVQGNSDAADAILREALLEYPPAMAVLQLLIGCSSPNRGNVEAILRSRGFLTTQPGRCIGSLLMLMNRTKLIRYEKSSGAIRVLWTPADEPQTPRTMFISPDTPFGNRAWLRAVLRQCRQEILWLDKHFSTAVLDDLWSTVAASRVSSIRILSLLLADNSARGPAREFRTFVREMDSRGVSVEWRTLASTDIRDTHDRWIVTSNAAWNVPNVNAIVSGQNSEMCESDSHAQLRELFMKYWQAAKSVV